MPATDRIKKRPQPAQKLAENHLQRSKGVGPKSQLPPSLGSLEPTSTSSSGHSWNWRHQERKADLGACFTPWDPGALDAGLCFQEHFLAVLFLAMTDCYEMHKQCRRRPSCLRRPRTTANTLQQYAEVKKPNRTNCHFQKNLHSAGMGLLCFGFHFFFFFLIPFIPCV